VIPTDGERVAFSSATGLGYALFPNLVFDVALDVGLNDAAPSYVFQVGLTASMVAVPPRRPAAGP
jgi:hypothetical protein